MMLGYGRNDSLVAKFLPEGDKVHCMEIVSLSWIFLVSYV